MKTKKMLSMALVITVIISLVAVIPTAAGTQKCCCLHCTWTKDAREYRDNYLKCLLAEFVFADTYDNLIPAYKAFIHSYWENVTENIDTWQAGLWPLIWATAPPPPTADPWLPTPQETCTVNKTEIDTYLLWGGVVWQNATTYPLHGYEWWLNVGNWTAACTFMTQVGYMYDYACGYRDSSYNVIPRPPTHVLLDCYEFFDTANLTSTHFNVSVMVQNVTDMGTIHLMLGYDNTVLEAVRVYPTAITADPSYWLPVDPPPTNFDEDPIINNTRTYLYQGVFPYAYVWIGSVYFTPYNSPDPYTQESVFDIEFHIIKEPPYETVEEPENKSLCSYLDLFIMFDSDVYPGEVELLDSMGDPIYHAALDGRYCYIRPQKVVGEPTAVCEVTPAKQVVGQPVTFDGSQSKDGAPPDPDDNDDIIWYYWDVGCNGSDALDINTTDPTTTFTCEEPGTYTVCLTVCNLIGKTDTSDPQEWECILPLGARQDLYTSENRFCNQTTTFIGTGLAADDPANQYVDALSPDVEITLFVKCTWNDAPRMHVLVGFEILYEWELVDQELGFPEGYTPRNECIAYRTAETNKDGIANITFRVPTWCTGLPFGKWLVIASCKIQEIPTIDWIRFHMGYAVEIKRVETDKGVYKVGENIKITIHAKNIMFMPKSVLLVATVYDDCGVPIGQCFDIVEAPPSQEYCHPYQFTFNCTVTVPQWTYVGIGGMVYASAFTDWPRNLGTAYCPEKSVGIELEWDC